MYDITTARSAFPLLSSWLHRGCSHYPEGRFLPLKGGAVLPNHFRFFQRCNSSIKGLPLMAGIRAIALPGFPFL
jgi:hypothetical protein